jgi:hypothetical protein
MLSTAAVALLTSAAFADTSIDSSKSEPYTTGALLSGNTGQASAGNITITSAGSVSVAAAQGALTIDSNNWLLQQGTLANKDKDGSSAIHVDLSEDRDFTGTSFVNTAGTRISNTGIYLDSSSTTSVNGNGTGKYGILLDAAGCTMTPCSFKGAITTVAGSSLTVSGDQSTAIAIGTNAQLVGDLTIAGTVSASSTSTTQTATSMFGLYSLGTIQGNVTVAAGGTLAAAGHGAEAMAIMGGGVTGSITIGGALTSSVVTKQVTSYTQQVNTTTNPEGGPAMNINANVGGGIAILGATTPSSSTVSGSVGMQGTGPAINISPLSTATTSLTIGVYTADTANPGFSFYNRGSIQATYTNYNRATTAMQLSGFSATQPTELTGGLFNSGAMSAAVLTNGTGQSTSGIAAIGLSIGNYVNFLPGSAKNAASGSTPGDQAALVISGAASSAGGSISASVTGSRGGIAQALTIGSLANVPSLINAGTISAMVTTSDATLAGTVSSSNPVAAYAIIDASGSLTSIYNAGTISAVAGYQASQNGTVSALDNNSQTAVAIVLGGGASSASAAGVSILNYSSSTRAATISGDIVFGTGLNQVLDLQGNGPSQASTVTGNVTYGMISSGSTSGDKLRIGNYSILTGQVITQETVRGAGVAVDVETHGVLNLLNTTNSLNATSFTVVSGGTVNLGVNKSLTAVGGVVAAQSVSFASDASLGVTYESFVPQAEHQFVLMTADANKLTIGQSTLDAFNNPVTGSKPYLLKTATLCLTSSAGCPRPASLPVSQDALLIDVAPKSAAELGLTVGSIALAPATTSAGAATTLFDQANIALASENDLGSAFINGIHNQKEAQQAYNNMAPNLTGGTRAIAISITDSATGPVGARQRALRMYGKTGGEMTLWGQEFVQMIKDPGQGAIDPNTGFKAKPGFKDHGFGFALGLDSGSPKYGWYGGALTFYAGDVNELSRNSHENQQWYLLSLYSSWRGTGLFLDTKLDAGYGHIDGKRAQALALSSSQVFVRVAENKHAGALLSGSVSTGGMFSYGATTLMPQLSLDGLYLREEGYTEHNPSTTTVGDAYDLKVNQYYAKSLRVFAGFDARYDLELWDFFLQPEARVGYRYDLVNDPVKLKMAFAYADTSSVTAQPGTEFTLTGPDPSQGNFVLGGTLAATTNSWTLGLNFDYVRGSNGAIQEVATVNLLGRI